jgi:hypothetical protein
VYTFETHDRGNEAETNRIESKPKNNEEKLSIKKWLAKKLKK